MKEENKKITLSLGDVSWNNTLGIYYIDMRPSIIHYTDNIYDGCFDDNGVPMISDQNGGFYYSTVNICQYAFIIHAEYIEKQEENSRVKLKSCIDVLEKLKTETNNHVYWSIHKYNKRYDLAPPWVGAMDQGQALSLYTRYYQVSKEDYYLNQAKKITAYFEVDMEKGGFKRIDENGNVWFEEYPSSQPSFVLNGFIYAIYGLIDFYRVNNDKKIKKMIDKCFMTIKESIHLYDSGYWSYYDQLKKELVRYYYQKNVHVPQLESIYLLTNDKIFLKYYKKWKKTINPINYFFVQIMYRILPRYRQIMNSKK